MLNIQTLAAGSLDAVRKLRKQRADLIAALERVTGAEDIETAQAIARSALSAAREAGPRMVAKSSDGGTHGE